MEVVNGEPLVARNGVLRAREKIVETLSTHIVRERMTRFWMNPVVEMSPLKSDLVDELARVVVLRQLLESGDFSRVIYSGKSKTVSAVVSALCAETGVSFSKAPLRGRFRREGGVAPRRVMAFVYLAHHFWSRWPLRAEAVERSGRLTFVSYFAHLDWDELENGRFKSYQWSELRESLLGGEPVDWLHLYISTTGRVSPKTAGRLIEKFQSASDSHRFLDAELDGSVVIRAVSRSIWNSICSSGVRALDREMARAGFSAEWSVVRRHCLDGLVGVAFARNLLTDLLIERSVSRSPSGSTALLLWENQPWERSFVNHWHRSVGGKVLAYAHTTVVFWYIPYFDWFLREVNAREFGEVSADRHLVNGPLSLQTLTEAHQPVGRFTEVEAFRYLNLQAAKLKQKAEEPLDLTVLVAGEIRKEPTLRMLDAVMRAAGALANPPMIIFKPHPASDAALPMEISERIVTETRNLSELFSLSDVVLGCAGTSAVVEAVAVGIPCASFLSPGELNFSSLVGWKDHRFLRNSEEVSDFLGSFAAEKVNGRSDLFLLDRNLSRWSEVLKLVGISPSPIHQEGVEGSS